VAKEFQPRPVFDIQQFYDIVITVKKIEELLSFEVQYLESHFPSIHNVIAFAFLTKVLRYFVRKKEYRIEKLHFLINNFVESPVTMVRALPKFNRILLVMQEEITKLDKGRCCINLIRMGYKIKDLSSCIY